MIGRDISMPSERRNMRIDDIERKVTAGNAYGEQSLNNEPLDSENLYIQHRTLLLFVACRKFRVPDADAENLIQEVFLSYLQTEAKIDNVREWLVARMCEACRLYWREQGPLVPLPDAMTETEDPIAGRVADDAVRRLELHTVLSYLKPPCRDVLLLYYFEGKSAAEIGLDLGMTTQYVHHLISNCRKRFREIYKSLGITPGAK